MAITRAQQFRQMLEDGGMLVKPGRGKRPGYRGDAAYGDRKDKEAIGDGKASPGFDQSAKPGEQSPEVYGASGKQYDPDAAKAAAIAQGRFKKKNPIRKFAEGYTKNTRKFLYNTFPNNPSNELDYLKQLPAAQRALLSPALKAKLEALELDEDQDLLGTAKTKFTFDEFEELKDFQPTEGLNFAEYAAKFKGAPGLLYSGDVGNLIKTRNPDGTFSYKRDFSQDDPSSMEPDFEARLRLLEEQKNKDLQNQLAQQDQNRQLFRLMAEGGMTEDAPVGGIMDLESGRQMYFLGKLVKKATRAVKKIVKSPIGKAALFAGLGAYGFGAGPFKGIAGSGFLKSGSPLMNVLFKKGTIGSGLTGKGMLALGGALTAAPLLFGKQEEDDTIDPALLGPRIDIARLLERPYEASLGMGFRRTAADGGRMGLNKGTTDFMDFVRSMGMSQSELQDLDINSYNAILQAYEKAKEGEKPTTKRADGGIMRIGYQEGSEEPVAKKTMPLLDMDGQEMDLRDNGGFVPIGRMEKADDVQARLSKNEFVFTADAVRNAGDGDIDKGAEVMYNMMKNLEDGGNVSEESQGLEGARNMFQTAQRLEEVL